MQRMSASTRFKRIFTKKHLKEIYLSDIRYKSGPGIDRINNRCFNTQLGEHIDIIYRKANSGKYRFSQYRERLLPRGPNRYPRVISIPTIRDKIVQKAVFEVLHSIYGANAHFLHQIIYQIREVVAEGTFDCVLRLDVSDFYPSVKHERLLREIKKKIRKKELIHLIKNSISQPTVATPNRKLKKANAKGIPQGLSISNILANIYMTPIDARYSNSSTYRYFRYVDDILILCASNDMQSILHDITASCEDLGLVLHSKEAEPAKTSAGKIDAGFTYLGYEFDNSKISVRKKSVQKIRETIVKSLTNYKYSSTQDLNLLKWNIDLRITGCVFNETKYGWLFFFSQIDDRQLLKSLDHFVSKQLERFGVSNTVMTPKRFMRAFHEITQNFKNTRYVPNFDLMPIQKKRSILAEIFGLKTQVLSRLDVEYQFNKRIYRTIKELEKDIARPS